MNTTQKRCYILNRVKSFNKSLRRLRRHCATLQGSRDWFQLNFTAFPLRGRWAADCAARMRWQLFISLFIKLRLDFFHLISRLRATVSLRLGHAPALNVHRTFIHYRRAASLPCNKGRHEKFLLTSGVPKYITYNTPFCR